MKLWTIQPEEVYIDIINTGQYICDFTKSKFCDLKDKYDWLVKQMINRIGPPPASVQYPVWAWHTWEGTRKKPDLRSERWGNGWKGDRFVCVEIAIPDCDVLLSDFDAWSIILLNGFLSFTEEDDQKIEAEYNNLTAAEQKDYKEKNWEGAFDIVPFSNSWTTRGHSIQATFWELKKEQIRKVCFFTAALEKPDYLK